MKLSRATQYLVLFGDFLRGAVRARALLRDDGNGMYAGMRRLARDRALNAKSCLESWVFHCRQAGAFSQEVGLP